MPEELIGEVRRGRRLRRVAEGRPLGPQDLGRGLAAQGTLVEPDRDVARDAVVDLPQRRDHAGCAGEQEGGRQTGVVAEQLIAARRPGRR